MVAILTAIGKNLKKAPQLFLNLGKQMKHRHWVHKVNTKKEKNWHHRLIKDVEADKRFHMCFRMSNDQFNYLHTLLQDGKRKITRGFVRRFLLNKDLQFV